MTYDDVLNELMEEKPTAEFWKDYERRMKEPDVPWSDVKKRLKL